VELARCRDTWLHCNHFTRRPAFSTSALLVLPDDSFPYGQKIFKPVLVCFLQTYAAAANSFRT
jgi:hypothetical protein